MNPNGRTPNIAAYTGLIILDKSFTPATVPPPIKNGIIYCVTYDMVFIYI